MTNLSAQVKTNQHDVMHYFHDKTFFNEAKWLLKWFEWMFTDHVQFGIDPQNIQSQHF